jgi:hypothetical protein
MQADGVSFGTVTPDYDIWDPRPASVNARWPKLTGAPLVMKARRSWVMKSGVTIPFFHKNTNKPKLMRSKLNKRNQGSTRRKLRASLKQSGYLEGARAEPVVIAQDGQLDIDSATFDVLAAGHIIEECYALFDSEPSNPQMMFTKSMGLPGVTVLYPQTPPDGQTFFKSLGNETNYITAGLPSVLEKYDKIREASQAFKEHKKAKKLQASDDGCFPGSDDDVGAAKVGNASSELRAYKEEWMFVQTNFNGDEPKLAGRDEYKTGKAWLQKMEKSGLYKAFEENVNSTADFSNEGVGTSIVVQVNAVIANKLWEYPDMMMCAYRFSLPSCDGVPWALASVKDCEMLNTLFTPLVEKPLLNTA